LNILVTSYWGTIQEYTSIGSLVREVRTSGGPWQAVEVSEDVWAVSFNTVNQVSLIYVNGTVLFSTVAPGSSFYLLGLVVDKQGYVFVADYVNNQVLVLNPTLTAAQPLRVTGNATVVIYGPQALGLDPSTSYLYVGETRGPCRVLVFDVSHVSTFCYTP
jgi:hypothetical protein